MKRGGGAGSLVFAGGGTATTPLPARPFPPAAAFASGGAFASDGAFASGGAFAKSGALASGGIDTLGGASAGELEAALASGGAACVGCAFTGRGPRETERACVMPAGRVAACDSSTRAPDEAAGGLVRNGLANICVGTAVPERAARGRRGAMAPAARLASCVDSSAGGARKVLASAARAAVAV